MNLVINFSHPLNTRSEESLKKYVGNHIYVCQGLKVDFGKNLVQQISDAVDNVEKTLACHATPAFPEPYLENLSGVFMISPGLSDPTALLVIELYGRLGFFPNLLLMKRDHQHGGFRIYDCAIGQTVRNQARNRRRHTSGVV